MADVELSSLHLMLEGCLINLQAEELAIDLRRQLTPKVAAYQGPI